jgi:hypothetical protein
MILDELVERLKDLQDKGFGKTVVVLSDWANSESLPCEQAAEQVTTTAFPLKYIYNHPDFVREAQLIIIGEILRG